MLITEEYANARFQEFNKLIFDGNLPEIKIEIKGLGRPLGLFCAKAKFYGAKNASCHFAFNTRYELLSDDWDDVIIHEMIHYNQWVCGVECSPHGKYFKSLMNEINKKFNRNVTIRYKGTFIQTSINGETQEGKYGNYCIAVFNEPGGMVSVKRLSFETERRDAFLKYAKETFGRETARIVVSNNPYFGNLPSDNGMKTLPRRAAEVAKQIEDKVYKTFVYDVNID